MKNYSVKTEKKGRVFDLIRSYMVNGGPEMSTHVQTIPLSVKLSPDGAEINVIAMEMNYRALVVGLSGSDYRQEIYFCVLKLDAESGQQLANGKFKTEAFGFGENEWVQTAAVHPKGTQFAVTRANKIMVIDPETGEIAREIGDGNSYVSKFDYSPSGRFMYWVGNTGFHVLDSETGDEVFSLNQPGSSSIAFSKDETKMVSCKGSKDSEVVVYDTKSWSELVSRNKTEADRRSIAFSPDGQNLLIGLGDCRMELWDLDLVKRK